MRGQKQTVGGRAAAAAADCRPVAASLAEFTKGEAEAQGKGGAATEPYLVAQRASKKRAERFVVTAQLELARVIEFALKLVAANALVWCLAARDARGEEAGGTAGIGGKKFGGRWRRRCE